MPGPLTRLPQRRKDAGIGQNRAGGGVDSAIRYAAWALVLLCGPAAAAGPSADAVARVEAFADWARSHAVATRAASSTELAQGAALAEDRRVAMLDLIQSDPARAYALALPEVLRRELPDAIAARIERRHDALGLLTDVVGMYHGSPTMDHAAHAQQGDGSGMFGYSVRTPAVVIDGEGFLAYTYGRRAGVRSLTPVPIHGVSVDHHMAVSEDATRVLAADELASWRGLAEPSASCGAGAELPIERQRVDTGGSIERVCSLAERDALEMAQARFENAGRDGLTIPAEPLAQSTYTTGAKTFLYIRLRFADQADTAAPSVAAIDAQMGQMRDHERAYSYNQLSNITWTQTPLIALSGTAASYTSEFTLYTEGRTLATALGFNTSSYSFFTVGYFGGPGSFGGQAYVGAPGMWLKSTSGPVATHELGHNLGIWHANYWTPAAGVADPIGPGANQEYGNPYDTMGSVGANNHYTASHKEILTWLQPEYIQPLWGNATYRIHSQDIASLPTQARLAAQYPRDRLWLQSNTRSCNGTTDTTVPVPCSGFWWLEHRVLRSEFDQALHSNLQRSGDGNWLVDHRPGSRTGKSDAGVWLGRTMHDLQLGIRATPVRKYPGTPAAFDLVFRRGDAAGNRAPVASLNASANTAATGVAITFTASATDADGDTLAWFWDWGDGTFGNGNQASSAKSWSTAGRYRVVAIATDMKGGESSVATTVTIGTPTGFSVSGRVLADGVGVRGALVARVQGSTTFSDAITDDAGNYTLNNVAAGAYTLTARVRNHLSSAGFTNPVTVGADMTNQDFTAVPLALVSIDTLDGVGSAATGEPLAFRVRRTGPTTGALKVWFRRGGTAFSSGTSGDYTMSTGAEASVTLAIGASETTITVTPTIRNPLTTANLNLQLALADGVEYRAAHPSLGFGTIEANAGPANDHFANRVTISGATGTLTATNYRASREGDEPLHSRVGHSSVWWTWTAPTTGVLTLDTSGSLVGASAMNTLIGTYNGNALGQLVPRAANDDAGTNAWSRVNLSVAAGEVVQIAVDSPSIYGTPSSTRLNWSFAPGSDDVLLRDSFEL